jgi:Tfp pilus assembly protein PilO
VNSAVNRIRSSRRASAVTIALVIVLVAAAAWVAVVSPKRSHASALKSDVANAQGQLVTAQQQAVVANKAAAAAALEAMPSDADEPGLLDQLQALGKKTKVTVATVTPNTGTTTTTAVPLSVTVNGTYFQISNFLNKLRTQVRVGKGGRIVATGRLFDVQSVNLAPGTGAGKLAATITVNASVYGTPAPAVTPTTTGSPS